MAENKMGQARMLVKAKRYDEARALLESMPNNLTALKWLAHLDEIAPVPTATGHAEVHTTQTWEYRVIHVHPGIWGALTGKDPKSYAEKVEEVLQEYGQDGWELVDITWRMAGYGFDAAMLSFKRPIY